MEEIKENEEEMKELYERMDMRQKDILYLVAKAMEVSKNS